MSNGVLYISYDGMLEPLGQSQVLAYLEHLATDRPVHLLSFEKSADWAEAGKRQALAARIAAAGIQWHPRRYHKRPSALATAWDILVGLASGLRLVRRHCIGIVHARSYVPAVMALALKRLAGVKFIFDMRGFWADERTDAGQWQKDSAIYRIAKRFERAFLENADHIVSLTHAGVKEIEAFPYLADRSLSVSVIPTCVDVDKFKPCNKSKSEFVLGYVGTTTGWYLFDPVVRAFVLLRDIIPSARMLIVNRHEHEFIRSRLCLYDVPLDTVTIVSASHDEVPALMSVMHATAFFIKPVFSKRASAPTKLGEFLASGVPCLTNSGVGDTTEIIRSGNCGIVIDAFDDDVLLDGLRRLVDLSSDSAAASSCVSVAHQLFSLSAGVSQYDKIYRSFDRSS